MRHAFTVAILLLYASALGAQVLRFDAETVDFGTVKPGTTQHAVFRFVNDGQDTLRLLDPRPSCGCTAALLSSSVLAPGDSGSISVDFRASVGMFGSTTKTISVYSGATGKEERLALLRITADVVGDLRFEPSTLRFRTVAGQAETLRVTLSSDVDTPLRLDNVSASLLAFVDTSAGNAYHAESVRSEPFTGYELLVDVAELPPRESTDLLLVVRPEYKGQINGMLRIALPRSEIRIPVTGVVLRN